MDKLYEFKNYLIGKEQFEFAKILDEFIEKCDSKPEQIKDEKFTPFWGGTFSQWLSSDFVIHGIKYNGCEQYMMAEKARLFGDNEMLEQIMTTDKPSIQKKCGRKIKNFDPDKWNSVAKDIVYKANYAKFTQNPKLLKDLLETEGTTLVEASPYDKIWGIGMGADDPRVHNRAEWNGTNWLGEVITNVREDICSELERGE